MSKINDIASAIAEVLKEYEAEVVIVPHYEMEDTFQKLHVSVCPVSVKMEMLSRGVYEQTYIIEIGVVKHFSTQAEFESMMNIIEDICAKFKHKRLSDAGAFCSKIENDPAYVHEHVLTLSQFTGIVTLYFKALQ